MEAKNDMVSFRAGALNDRLRSGPLTAGGKTKRDLARYYALLEQSLNEWSVGVLVGDGVWDVIVAFVNTRYWDTIPLPLEFFQHFDSFARSPMAKDFDKQTKSTASSALRSVDFITLAAIIDRGEVNSQAGAKAGGTSAGA